MEYQVEASVDISPSVSQIPLYTFITSLSIWGKMLLYNIYTGLLLLQAEFSIWTREAGAGGLSVAVEGPSRAEISFEDRKDGSCEVSYVAQEPGRGHSTWSLVSTICPTYSLKCSNLFLYAQCFTVYLGHVLLRV